MLVLKRQLSEVCVITVPPSTSPREIRVMVVEGAAKLGFTADRDVLVMREELLPKPKAAEDEDTGEDLRW